MTDVAVIGFDYSAVPADKAASARAAAERIRGRMQLAEDSIIAVGRELIEQKESLGYGRFLPWLEAEFQWSQSYADRFIQVAKTFGSGNYHLGGNLTFKALAALAAPSTPDSIREEVLDRAAAGEKVTAKEIEDLKKKLKAAQQKAANESDRAKVNIARADRADEALDTAKYKVRHLETQVERLTLEVSRLHEDGVIHVIKSEPEMVPPLPSSTPTQTVAQRFNEVMAAIPGPHHDNDDMEAARLVAAANAALRALRTPQQWADVASMNADEWRAAYRSL